MLDPVIGDWLHLLVRWVHVVVGAAWIGTSFYFNWLNNHVRPPEQGGDPRVKGELWSVHGGAFYKVTKFAGAPEKLPETLHWFMYEAYFTWITGVGLLLLVYWLQAKTYLIDPSIADLSAQVAVGIGVGTLVVGWVVYDLLCKSPLQRWPTAFAVVGISLVTLVAWGLSEVFSARAAYVHVGAMLGTIMAANVFFVIIPGQRAMVDAMVSGREPPLERGKAGALRSLHNNYLTLPVLFVMVSNHFPFTFGHAAGWAILVGLTLIGMAVRHWFNLRGQGEHNGWLLPVAAVALVALAFVTRPVSLVPPADGVETVSLEQVQAVVMTRCTPCHATQPSHPAFASPPKDVVFEDGASILRYAELIHQQAVISKIMPLGNLTQMTDAERALIGAWYAQREVGR
jgi:uncharacterized membrane protein